ncbi:DUF2252 family protein [Microscilla marina]|uniref:DUF2252 domain-containing protein n=1 Tax=Microscilla marina ATCC 23134 TaxID=313606 RepID=A1ZSR8_MICM2|nr:DUF2252 family protein [Microscilla marina]EAY26648.1 hypothetical protein M23134_06177 [Microscilla marina ATCC 23134]
MNIFSKKPEKTTSNLSKKYLDNNRGFFLYFRHMSMKMQERFAQLYPHKGVPQVFLHGNPHIENYTINGKGAAMIDFDRSRIGPYVWDIVRFLASVSVKRKEVTDEFLSKEVLEYFLEGYLRSFHAPHLPYKPISTASNRAKFTVWHNNVEEYLKANIKWAKRMRNNPVRTNNKDLKALLQGYLQSRNELDLLGTHKLTEAGQATGTFGNQRFLMVLSPQKNTEAESVFLDIKTVYQDPDNRWYYNPYNHHGIRMIEASKLYAPGVEQRMGYVTYQNQEYWGRAIPPKNAKLKANLNSAEQIDMAYSVATQLGSAHRKSLQGGVEALKLEKHLLADYTRLTDIAHQMNMELMQAYQAYVQQLNATKAG